MKKRSILVALLLMTIFCISYAQNTNAYLPDFIYSGKQGNLHVQGVAFDKKNGVVYFSYTNKLLKMDLSGKLIGSVTGFVGHLGDLDFNEEDGKIYGSLEYKNDAIGKGIRSTLGVKNETNNGFYIAIFDGSKIVRPDMKAEESDLLNTVYLPEVLKDFEAEVSVNNEKKKHRHGCSGIDGVTFAPAIGSSNQKKNYLYVSYGIYGDNSRDDNDHQVILMYDIKNWTKYAKPLSQSNLHHSGPKTFSKKYFLKTGNTRYGVQNLAYDPYSNKLFAAVYRGAKEEYPNYDLFVVDLSEKSKKGFILSDNKNKKVDMLTLADQGPKDSKSGVRGWYFQWGATGLCPIGDGTFYISHNTKSSDGQQQSTIFRYKWIGNEKTSFERLK